MVRTVAFITREMGTMGGFGQTKEDLLNLTYTLQDL